MPGLPDPGQWARDLFPQAVAALLSALTFGLSDLVRALVQPDSPVNFVSRTPPGLSYDSPTVATLWEATRTIANAALAAVVVWGGFNAMARPYFGSTYHDVMELVPRVLLGAVLANTSRDWCRLAIDFNNAFSDAIGNVTPPGFDQAPGAGQVLINVVSGLIYVVMGLLLALQMLMRLGLVDLLVVVAPLAMLCWVLPQTQGWARHWSALFTSTVFVQALQVLGLKLGVSLAGELPVIAGGVPAELVRTFLGIAILALVLKLPRFMPGPSRGAGGVVALLEAVAIGRALDDLTHRVEAALDGMLAHSRVAIWEQERGFHTCLPEGRDGLLVYRNLDTTSLAMTVPLVGASLTMDSGVLYGVAPDTQSPVIIDPFDRSLENANLVVVAPSGSGKSYFVKLLALRNLIQGVDFLVIDPEDEYRAVCAAAGGQYIQLASSSPHRLNPFDLPARGVQDDAEGQDPLAERVTALHSLLAVMLTTGGGSPPDARERAALDRALYQTYARAGITADPSTHERPAPLLRELHEVLVDMPGDVAVSLAARLEPFVQGSLAAGLFAGPTNVQLDGRLVVFTIQQLADELRPMAIQLIAGHVWNRVRRQRRPRLLIVDEAWRLFEHPEGGAFLAGLARRARKYWLGLVTISQLVTDYVEDRHGKAVFQNAPMKLVLKQDSDGIDRAAEVLKLTEDERRLLLAGDKGEGLLFARGSRLHITIQASQAEHRLATTAPAEVAALGAAPVPAATAAGRHNGTRQGGSY